MTQCATLWIGERLGAVERACLRSVVRQGHELALYCYRRPAGVPEGVEIRDAADVLPPENVFRHRRGSFGPFADWFRYELQRRAIGTWVDTDIYLVAPLDGERLCLFGEQEPGVLNNAVLRLPPDSPVLAELLRPFEEGVVPQWLPLRSLVRARARALVRGRVDVARLPWGSTGPHALTAAAAKFGLISEAAPADVFYPVAWRDAGWIDDPTLTLEQMVTKRTIAVHLWNECIKGFKNRPAPEGCFLNRLQSEGAE